MPKESGPRVKEKKCLAVSIVLSAISFAMIGCNLPGGGSNSSSGSNSNNQNSDGGSTCSNTYVAGDTTNNPSGSVSFLLADGEFVAGKFTLNNAETINTIEVPIANESGYTAGSVYMLIEADNGGDPDLPDGGVAESPNPYASVSVAVLPTTPSNVAFTPSSPLSLSAGTYWVMLGTNGADSEGLPILVDTSSPNGAAHSNDNVHWAVDNFTMNFAVEACE